MSEILLGVGGGIAAYKSCELLRRLQDLGHQVTVVPTPASLNFVGKATWEALSGRAVRTEVWQAVDQVNHIRLGESCEYIIIAPATADLIARIANGRADDLLTNSILASSAPKLVVPAMHPKMWRNLATQDNVAKLRDFGFHVMEPAVGRLTGADSGIGRFPEVTDIIDIFNSQVAVVRDLLNVKVLITAGGTREAIDDVRFIGNRSSGKQGIAIAQAAKARGAEVTLIGANLDSSNLFGIRVIPVVSTSEMKNELNREFKSTDVLIMAAAVSDVRPESTDGKIKKEELTELNLIKNPDLLAEIGQVKGRQLLVGFAAEQAENLLVEGKRKLQSKNLDLIYANDIASGQIFGSDKTSGYLIDKNQVLAVAQTTKNALAGQMLDLIAKQLNSDNG